MFNKDKDMFDVWNMDKENHHRRVKIHSTPKGKHKTYNVALCQNCDFFLDI